MENSWLFQQARCEVTVKYTSSNLLEHEWIRTGIRTWGSNWQKKIRPLKLSKMFTGSYQNECNLIFYFASSEKHVTWRNKWLNLWNVFIVWVNQFLIPADWIIENDLHQILYVVNFFGLFFVFLAQNQQNNFDLSKSVE